MFRTVSVSMLWVVVLGIIGSEPAHARYRYGQYTQGGSASGFFVFGEGLITNPRNVDAVVATVETLENFGGGQNQLFQVNPTWGEDLAGRLGFGYGWATGNRVSLTLWGFSADQSAQGSGPPGGATYFAIGPPIRTGSSYAGAQGSPGSYSIGTEVEAGTADVAFSREETLSESFTLEWSLGLRYASYEERSSGFYDEAALGSGTFGLNSFAADKRIESEMFGVRAAFRGSYRFTQSFSVDGGLGFAFLDGEQVASSGLTPTGLTNSATTPSSFVSFVDDSRSGATWNVDLTISWWVVDEAVRLWAGWEQQVWETLTVDLVRNLPGTVAPLTERDSVAFSGYKIGVFVRF
ncbi:MAG TPA: hypothetical protein VD788_14880 [Candidatus Polarisedimenticolaceae bacterium]|nr:hypothetical protein [Candidatus Polarisedimenticolaceae bacterium]